MIKIVVKISFIIGSDVLKQIASVTDRQKDERTDGYTNYHSVWTLA